MKKLQNRQQTGAFHDSMALETALCELYGIRSAWYHSAGTFKDYRKVRSALRAAVRRLRQRICEIVTADDRLLLTAELELDALDRSLRALKSDGAALLDITAHLLHLTAGLLGYDWLAGKPNRHIVFYQTRDQVWIDDKNQGKQHPVDALREEQTKRAEIICKLFKEGIRVPQIAAIMSIPETRVKDILVREQCLKRSININDA
jgi:hypothetical protein